jgi:hypothetical protein
MRLLDVSIKQNPFMFYFKSKGLAVWYRPLQNQYQCVRHFFTEIPNARSTNLALIKIMIVFNSKTFAQSDLLKKANILTSSLDCFAQSVHSQPLFCKPSSYHSTKMEPILRLLNLQLERCFKVEENILLQNEQRPVFKTWTMILLVKV